VRQLRVMPHEAKFEQSFCIVRGKWLARYGWRKLGVGLSRSNWGTLQTAQASILWAVILTAIGVCKSPPTVRARGAFLVALLSS
jgi:hypothetical protein